MRIINKISVLLFVFIQTTYICLAEEPGSSKGEVNANDVESTTVASDTRSKQKPYSFQGEVNADNINIRSDSTTGSEVICKINKSECVDVLLELYNWYKIRLPKIAPSFIKKDFVTLADNNTAKVIKDNVNIRLRSDTSSPILGKVNKGEVVNILEDKGDWYKIEPVANSFGWIHKSFVNKLEEKKIKLAKKSKEDIEAVSNKNITVEGIIKPKTFTRIATHKLISDDNKVYLLKGNKEDLIPLNHRRVKIIGKLVDPTKQKNPIIEVEKIEALD